MPLLKTQQSATLAPRHDRSICPVISDLCDFRASSSTNSTAPLLPRMASDLNQRDSLDEIELQGSCEEQTEKVRQLLEACDVIAQAKVVNTFLPKMILYITECQSESVLKALLPAAEKVCNTLYKDLQNWKDVDQIPVLLQVSFIFIAFAWLVATVCTWNSIIVNVNTSS